MLMQEIYDELRSTRELFVKKVVEVGVDSNDSELAYLRGKMDGLEKVHIIALRRLDDIRSAVNDIFRENRDFD